MFSTVNVRPGRQSGTRSKEFMASEIDLSSPLFFKNLWALVGSVSLPSRSRFWGSCFILIGVGKVRLQVLVGEAFLTGFSTLMISTSVSFND